MTARDARNHNPLNIRRGPDEWEGLASTQTDPDFCTFKSDVFGFRAGFRILIHYADAYSLNTVNGVISRWAPPSENDTDAYIAAVCKKTGFGPEEPLQIKTWGICSKLIYAMTEQESGAKFETNFKAKDLAEGALRAGIVDSPKTPVKKIGVVLTGAGAAAASIAPQAVDAFTQYRGYFDVFTNPSVKTGLAIVGAVLALLAIFNH